MPLIGFQTMVSWNEMDSTDRFYADLPSSASLLEAIDPARQHRLPSDWDLHLADVVGSTGAIQRGMYQAVNTSAVLALVAARNACEAPIPFSFGGDGMLVAAPRSSRASIRAGLAGIAKRIQEEFGLDLRIASVGHQVLLEAGMPVDVGKIDLAPWAVQAIFSGPGVPYSEHLLKHDPSFSIPASEAREPDLTGFECRWNPIRPLSGQILALLVDGPDPILLKETLETIDRILGDSSQRNPIQPDRLNLSWSWRQARREAALTGKSSASIWAQTLIGRCFMKFGIKQGDWNWPAYRKDLSMATDFQKMEGSLRLVLRGSEATLLSLLDWLSSQESRGLRWGAHRSPSAILTCVVRDYGSDHIHFVDGSDGGYALAALDLKKRFPHRPQST
jgi:hypothetical protein